MPAASPPQPTQAARTSLAELALLFLRLGTTAFGGPAAHVAMMQDEVVQRRRWLGEAEFLDLFAATNLIPGPNSTELAIHIGWRQRGLPGLWVAGTCFILPAMLLTGALAWAYVRYGQLPEARGLLHGIKPVIVAIVVQAIWRLAPKALDSTSTRVLGALALCVAALGVGELWIVLGAGLLAVALGHLRSRSPSRHSLILPLAPMGLGGAWVAALSPPVSSAGLFWVFCKIGSVLFGSGYVLLAFLRSELVERLGWISETQLLDAVAAGQVTPGPVFTTATFVGYVLAGPGGALAATAGIFLPAFLFVALSAPLLPRLRESRSTSAFLDGATAASLALMLLVTWQLGRAAIVDVPSALLAIAAAVILLRWRPNATWLVLGGAIAGLALQASGR